MNFPLINYASQQLQTSPLNDLIKNALSGYTDTTKAQFLRPTLQEQLQKAQLENKWYEPNIKSQIGLRGAQAGHLGAETEALNISNPFLAKKLQSEIEVNNANAQKARILQMIREQIMGGGQQGLPSAQPTMQPYQGQGMPNTATQQIQERMQAQQGAPFQEAEQSAMPQTKSALPFGGDYAKAAIASQLMGLGSGKIVDVNGKQVAITPFGNFDTGVQGLTEEQKARQAGFGKEDAKAYGDAVNTYKSYGSQGTALDELANLAENNPQFRNVTGPIKLPLTKWFGSPEQQQLLGQLQTSSGEIALQVASSLKGAWTGRDQSMVNNIKAGPYDFPDVFIGKIKAQKLINDALQERSKLVAENVRHGMSSIDALQAATKATPLSRFKPEIDRLITHKEILPLNKLEEARRILAKRETEEKEKKKKERKSHD